MTLSTAWRARTVGIIFMQLCALPWFLPSAGAATETVIYSFQNNGQDGYYPGASLTVAGDTLYGTTLNGGAGRCFNGCGIIFSVEPAKDAETALYSFRGKNPQEPGGLLKLGGQLFGTTGQGGNRSEGSLFSFDAESGTFDRRYSFCNLENCTDGANPFSGLIDWNGTLYGTTTAGGTNGLGGNGVAFSFNPKTGTEKQVYAFCSRRNCTDGFDPGGGLLRVKRRLYGVAEFGGRACSGFGSCGTVFALDPAKGSQFTLYQFCGQKNCADGARPVGALIAWNGLLYGVTEFGGSGSCSGLPGCGTAFSVDPATRTETVLHAFEDDGTDGLQPLSGLIELNGLLYGTTATGGANGNGTVYSIDPATGAETIVYSFCGKKGCADGTYPQASLVKVNGALYGTTVYGGTGSCFNASYDGCGTVFVITP